MGKQLEMPVQPIRPGDTITVSHEWGHKTEATYIGRDKFWADIRFGISGTYRVRVGDPTRQFQRGKFRTKKMRLWFIDTGTLERIMADEV